MLGLAKTRPWRPGQKVFDFLKGLSVFSVAPKVTWGQETEATRKRILAKAEQDKERAATTL